MMETPFDLGVLFIKYMTTNTRIIIAIVIFIICMYFFRWWGFLILIVLIPFIGWNDKHKGPFLYTRKGVTDFKKSDILFDKYPESHRNLQDLLVKISNENKPYNIDIQQDIEILLKKLKLEEYEEGSPDIEILTGFLNEFADVFPNWVSEYKYIHFSVQIFIKKKLEAEEKKSKFKKLFVEALMEEKEMQGDGLKKQVGNFTIVYVCQFCGRLINYSSTPCLFCCNFPKTKKEVVIAQALSSEHMEMDSLLTGSKMIKAGRNPEDVIPALRILIDDVFKNPLKFERYFPLFEISEFYSNNPDAVIKAKEINDKLNIFCDYCNEKIILADKPCFYCKKTGNDLTQIQKDIIALNGFLLFVENFMDFSDDKEAMTELIFVSVYILNNLLEKDRLPDQDLKIYWRKLLLQSKRFGNEGKLGVAIELDLNTKPSLIFENVQDKVNKEGVNEMAKLAENIIYFLKN